MRLNATFLLFDVVQFNGFRVLSVGARELRECRRRQRRRQWSLEIVMHTEQLNNWMEHWTTTTTKLQKTFAMQFSIRYTRSFQTCNAHHIQWSIKKKMNKYGIWADGVHEQWKWLLFISPQNILKYEKKNTGISSFAIVERNSADRCEKANRIQCPTSHCRKWIKIFSFGFIQCAERKYRKYWEWAMKMKRRCFELNENIHFFFCWRYHWQTLTAASSFIMSIHILDLFQLNVSDTDSRHQMNLERSFPLIGINRRPFANKLNANRKCEKKNSVFTIVWKFDSF